MKRTICTTMALLLAAIGAGAADAAELGYYAQPALHGDRLIFASEGDLWTARLDDGDAIVAHRLTASDGLESRPRMSPDGTRIAFAGEYDGNTDVYVMPVDGGEPRRLTFHPARDLPVGWSADGRRVLLRSPRAQPFGRDELYAVSLAGGTPKRSGFGECTMISHSATGRRFAFTRWSNETWHWKGYRGGTAPEIWIADPEAEMFTQLTDDPASDLFPMWLAGRVYFLSDRSGRANIWSDAPGGGDLRQHTSFTPVPGDPTAAEGYDVRWPNGDVNRGGTPCAGSTCVSPATACRCARGSHDPRARSANSSCRRTARSCWWEHAASCCCSTWTPATGDSSCARPGRASARRHG
jgi:tricorn protease